MRLMTWIAAAVATVSCTAQAQNLISNGSFEIPGPGFLEFADWIDFGNVNTADEGEILAQDGMFTAKMFGASSGAQSDQVLNQNVAAMAGEQYTLSAYAQNLSSDALGEENIILIQMVFKNDAGDSLEVVETLALDPVNDPMDSWIQSELTAIAPDGTTNIDVFLLHIQLGADQGFPTQGGGASFWDNITLTSGDAPCTNLADLDGNGELNFFDVSLFLSEFNKGCP